jgi:hypothetical protein
MPAGTHTGGFAFNHEMHEKKTTALGSFAVLESSVFSFFVSFRAFSG